MDRKIERALILTAMAVLATSCGGENSKNTPPSSDGSGKPQVFTVNYPLTYFAERIGGDLVDVVFPAPADGDPAFWEPNADEIAAYQAADLILLNGATYAKWLGTASLPESIQVETSSGFNDKLIHIHDAATHSHGSDGEHSHAGTAFTTWLDIGQAIQQATAIEEAMAGLLPDQKAVLEKNLAGLRADLEQLDANLAFAAQGFGETPLVASHPVYQYLARRYGLKIRSVLWEPETVPDDEAMADLKSLLEKHPANLMIWEGDPAPESVKKLEEIGLKSIVFDPCGNRPEAGEDFLSVMEANIASLGKAAPVPN